MQMPYIYISFANKDLPEVQKLIEKLKAVSGFTTLVLSVNTKNGNTNYIDSQNWKTVFDYLCNKEFQNSEQ